VTVVDHGQGVKLDRELADAGKVGDCAIHGENTVGDHEADVGAGGILQLSSQVLHIAVCVAVAARFAQANPIDNACVVEYVADNGVVWSEQGLEQPAIGIETRWVQYRVFSAKKGANACFKFLVYRLCSTDEPYRRHPIAVFIQRLVRREDNLRMIGEAQVIICAQVEYMLGRPIDAYIDGGLLGPRNESFRLKKALGPERLSLLGE